MPAGARWRGRLGGGGRGGPGAPTRSPWERDARGFGIEYEGVSPDVEVEQWPADVIAGHDPQLEKAIEIVLQKLKENPPERLKRQPFPVRVKRGTATSQAGSPQERK